MKLFSVRLKILDILSPVVSAGVALFLAVQVYAGNVQPSLVSIRSQSGTEVYPLSEERMVEVEGPLGTTVVVISEEGSAAIVESPCPNKLCVHAGELSRGGDWSACMPNKVFVRIDGGTAKDKEVDASVY